MVLGWVSESVEGWVERKYSGGIETLELGWLELGFVVEVVVVEEEVDGDVEEVVLEDEEM